MNRIYFFKLFSLLIFLNFCSSLSSQNSYFIKDTTITYGSKNVDNNKSELNSRFCEIKDGDSIISYTPYQVSEYGFDDERIFIAKKVQLPDSLQTVFLERLVTGKMTLYYYKGQNYTTFFVSKDSTTLVELPCRNKIELPNFRKQLTELIARCVTMEEASKLVVYNRGGMKEFFKRLNDCDSKPFPFLRYGFTTGVQFVRLNLTDDFISEKIIAMDYQFQGGFTAGLFVDIPIFPSSFSIYTGANLSKHGFSYFKNIEGYDVDFVLNITSLKVPLMVKYTLPWGEYSPYVGAGLTGTYHLRNKGEIYEMRNTGNVINIGDSYAVSAINNFQYGLVAETGVEKKLNYRNYLSLGFRYSLVPGNSNSFGSSEFSVITRINF